MSSTMLPSYASTLSPVGGALRPLQLSELAPSYRSPYHGDCGGAKWATPSVSPATGVRASQSQSQSQSPHSPAAKKTRKSRVVFDFSTEEMAKYFHMSQREAAAQLGVATVTIKRNCRRLGIVWPYRLLKARKLPQSTPSFSSSSSSSSYAGDSPVVNGGRWRAISREQARQIREERARARAQAKRNLSVVSAATAMTMLGRSGPTAGSSSPAASMTPAGRAFARLPLECMAENPRE